MPIGRRGALVFLASLIALIGCEGVLLTQFRYPFPPLSISLSTRVSQLGDFLSIAAGLRRIAADIAWVQALQYYGTPEAGQTELDFHSGGGQYPLLDELCQRVAQIDPYFTYVYYYGGGVLAWNLARPDEAENLLRLGIRNNPKEWRLQQYLGAIAYKGAQDPTRLIAFLESFIHEPDCPNLLRSILANFYKRRGDLHESLKVWLLVLNSGDPSYEGRAQDQIRELVQKLGIKGIS